MVLNDKFYKVMKWVNILAVPLATFLIGVYAAFMTHNVEAIITAVIGGLGTLAGVVLKVSDDKFYKNNIIEVLPKE